jgi:NADH-quinone oxidoreductase E subunit
MLSDSARDRIQTLIRKYPHPRSALIPALQLAQEEEGWLKPEVIRQVAEMFSLPPNEVYEVASFYTMLFKRPVGKYVIWVCSNISCLLCNSDSILSYVERKLGIKPGQTTPDGLFTLFEAECLASCGTAPVVQINDVYHENLTPEKLNQILDGLK